MVLRLSYYRFFIRLCCYPLPLFAFIAGAYVRFLSDKLGLSPFAYDLPFYVALLVFTTLVWIIAVEHYQLCSIEEFFREYTGLKKAAAACTATCILQLCALFFYRGHDLSRVFFTATAVALFVGTVLIRTGFRLLLWSAEPDSPSTLGLDSRCRFLRCVTSRANLHGFHLRRPRSLDISACPGRTAPSRMYPYLTWICWRAA